MIRRLLETPLKAAARRYPVVTVTGPRQSGKTTLVRAVEDARKLDEVREALRRGDLAAAGKIARVYRLMPVSA